MNLCRRLFFWPLAPVLRVCARRLWVKSMSLEVVYCAAAARWAQQFVAAPWGPHRTIAHVRDQTRARILTHWEHMLRAHPVPRLPLPFTCFTLDRPNVTPLSVRRRQGERRSWQVELDVSAPQILFVEQLSAPATAVMLVDFGRLRLANAHFADHAPPAPAAPPAPDPVPGPASDPFPDDDEGNAIIESTMMIIEMRN